MENKTESTVVYWCYVRIVENKMETTIMDYEWRLPHLFGEGKAHTRLAWGLRSWAWIPGTAQDKIGQDI